MRFKPIENAETYLPTHKPSRLKYGVLLSALILSYLSTTVLACVPGDIRYANSSNRIYIEQPVTCSLSDLTAKAPASALELVDSTNAIWMLRSNILIQNGGRLDLHSTNQGGDVNELRLKSDAGGFIYVQPNYGTLDVNGPLITSWDESSNSPDTNLSDGRAHLKARSFLDSSGVARESTVNIDNAELAYLGYNASESYGLALKVKAKRTETALFDQVDIFGTLTNSYVHDNYMGFYSWGAYGVDISNNVVANNHSYGIDPHDNSDYLTITNNHVHDNGRHGIICSQHCDHLTITGNVSERNEHGIMLHRSVTDTLVANNDVHDNRDAGIALFESFNNIVRDNTVLNNRNGIRLSVGSHSNLFENNTIGGNSSHGIYFYQGSDTPDVTDGRNRNNTFTNNDIEDSSEGFKISDSDDNNFFDNNFTGGTPFNLYQSVGNEFGGNSYEGLLDFNTKGNSTTHTSTTVDLDQNLVAHINSDADLTLTNGGGRVLAPEEADIPIAIAPSGTTLNLNSGNIGSKSDVTALDFWVAPQSSQVSILNPSWLSTKSWEAEGSINNLQTSFSIGGLTPNTIHTVKKDGTVLQETNSDSNGLLAFTDTLGSANTRYGYSVMQGSADANPTIVNLTPTDDSYVRGGSYANANYGSTKDVQAKNKGINNTYTRESFFKFDLTGQPLPSRVILTLAVKASSSEQINALMSAIPDTSWSEGTITYANKPAAGANLLAFTVTNTSYQLRDFDITDYVKAEKQAGRDVFSIAIKASNNSNSILKIASKDASSNQPVLSVTY